MNPYHVTNVICVFFIVVFSNRFPEYRKFCMSYVEMLLKGNKKGELVMRIFKVENS